MSASETVKNPYDTGVWRSDSVESLRKTVVQILIGTACTLSIVAVGASMIYIHLHDRNSAWEFEVYGLAGYVGSKRASDDFAHGKFRVFQLNGSQNSDSFTGQTDGPFEIWNHYYFPELGYPNDFSTRVTIKAYNSRMRRLYSKQMKVTDSNTKSTQPANSGISK